MSKNTACPQSDKNRIDYFDQIAITTGNTRRHYRTGMPDDSFKFVQDFFYTNLEKLFVPEGYGCELPGLPGFDLKLTPFGSESLLARVNNKEHGPITTFVVSPDQEGSSNDFWDAVTLLTLPELNYVPWHVPRPKVKPQAAWLADALSEGFEKISSEQHMFLRIYQFHLIWIWYEFIEHSRSLDNGSHSS